MASRIVVFGAAGYTGRLVVAALVGAGLRPVLAGRDADRLRTVEEGLEIAVADAGDHRAVRSLVEAGDVLVSTVGPFTRYGAAAVAAAVDAGAHYVDSTGEATFIRQVFQDHGPRAEKSGATLLTAFGYDFVPGNLAGALALRDAGEAATRVEIGYFSTGSAGPSSLSSGTRASITGGLNERHHAFREGALRLEPGARRVKRFGRERRHTGFSVGASEQLTLPALYPRLDEVNVYLGWLGPFSRAAQLASFAQPALNRLPGREALAARALRRTGSGPGPSARAAVRTLVISEVYGETGTLLGTVRLAGVNPYELTGNLIAAAAGRLAAGEVDTVGAAGPVRAFGLDGLEALCRDAGLSRES